MIRLMRRFWRRQKDAKLVEPYGINIVNMESSVGVVPDPGGLPAPSRAGCG